MTDQHLAYLLSLIRAPASPPAPVTSALSGNFANCSSRFDGAKGSDVLAFVDAIEIYKECVGKAVTPLSLYAVHLLLNCLWTPVFFGLHRVGLALIHIIVLDVLAIACAACFNTINKTASYWMMPYLAWLVFATCLNYTIWTLNDDDGDNVNLIE
ncbi:hypothetical protein K1T71_013462 [Dendrolimus kikuchii]|uniref:Uncharacterized protein n=1 Tax=Dendrolimus kikuchii TaxID=765133 RepID=A0ACC1CGG5_9NEOP|nr:hypothetical protein K1T71_013462 [Dendrolimus kikuchii]